VFSTLSSVQVISLAPCSLTPPVYFPFLMPQTKFHTHTETDKIVFLNIIIFTSLTADEETKGSGPNGRKYYHNSKDTTQRYKYYFIEILGRPELYYN
jgi:hypothetical protein